MINVILKTMFEFDYDPIVEPIEPFRVSDYYDRLIKTTEDLRTQLAYAMAQTSMSTAQAMQAMELMEARCNNECTPYWTF